MSPSVPDPPVWPGDHDAVRSLWALDPEAAFLSHGSFGATPRPVLEEQSRWRLRMEANPVDLLHRRYPLCVCEAREAVAEFLGADPAGLAFVPNATTGVMTVLRSLDLGPGDRVVVTDHVYAAVEIALRSLGVSLVVVPVELSDSDPETSLLEAVDPSTRLVVVDAVASGTAYVFDVARVVAGCREAGVPCLVDAAHAPGLLPVDLRALDPDYWAGNLHKWCCAPKGAAVLYVRDALRSSVRPLVPSHDNALGFPRALDWAGTHDPTPWLAAPAALDLMASLGWEAVRSYGIALAAWGAALLASVPGVAVPVPLARQGQMVLLDAGLPSWEAAVALRDRFWSSHRVEVGATPFRGRGWLRLSTAPYSTPEDVHRLATVLSHPRATLGS